MSDVAERTLKPTLDFATRRPLLVALFAAVVIGVPTALYFAAWLDPHNFHLRAKEFEGFVESKFVIVVSCVFSLIVFLLIVAIIYLRARLTTVRLAGSRGEFLPQALQEWPRSILNIIGQHTGELQGLVQAFLFAYARQENLQISGEPHASGADIRSGKIDSPPQNRIYTSFVSYSELVKVILAQNISRQADERIICFATISMPIAQWFNNKIHPTSDFHYTEVDANWNSYIKLMHSVAQEETLSADRPTEIYRLLQVVTRDRKVGPFFSEEEMKLLCGAKILIKYDDEDVFQANTFPKPFSAAEREPILAKITDRKLRNEVAKLYERVSDAYLIVPEGFAVKDFPPYRWMSVTDAFVELFNPDDEDEQKVRSYVHRIGERTLAALYRGDHGIPNDLFLVGRQKRGEREREWLFYLAGTTDEGCQMVRLEYGTSATPESPRTARIRKLANRVLDVAQGYPPKRTEIVEMRGWISG